MAFSHIASALNNLQNIVISLVGEERAEELERAQARWGRLGAEL